MTIPGYYKDPIPRHRLNDAVHKYARATGTPYNKAWKAFEKRFNTLHGVNLSLQRHRHAGRYGMKLTITAHLKAIGQIEAGVTVAMNMSKEAPC